MALVSPVEYAGPISSSQNYLACFGVPSSRRLRLVWYEKKSTTCQLVRAVSVDRPQLDFSNPDWKRQFQKDFDRRFSLPHLRDVIDVEPMPTTFSLNGRYQLCTLFSAYWKSFFCQELLFYVSLIDPSPNCSLPNVRNTDLSFVLCVLVEKDYRGIGWFY
jgi:hypothetical protein